MDASLLGDVSPLQALLLLAAAFAGAFVGGMSGFGTGMIVTLFIAPIVGPKAVIPVLSVFMTCTNASRVWFFRTGIDWKSVLLIAGPAIPATMLGAMLYVRIESRWIQVLLGLILMLAIPVRRWLEGKQIRPGPVALAVFGATFGFASSLIIGTGTLIIPLLLGTGLAGPALLGTDAAIAMLVNFARSAMFGKLDALTMPLFFLAAIMGLMTIPGTWAARWIVSRTEVRIHTIFIEALIIVGGLAMIVSALMHQ